MIRYLLGEEKQWCRELWEEAFREDSASFTDYYFSRALKQNRILAEVEDERVQSMIHLNPYDLWVRGRVWRADYLVGVATREALRRRGHMRRLMTRALRDLYGEGMPFCFLMPANEAIYRPFGFTYTVRKYRRETDETVSFQRRGIGDAPVWGELSEWLNAWLKQRYQMFALRDEDYLRRLAAETASEKGTFDLLWDGGIVGMESIWGLEEREQRFLYGDAPYVKELPAVEPVIMARILNLREFVRAARLWEGADRAELVIPLYVEDPLLSENGGRWLWHLDRETSWLERTAEENRDGRPLRLRIDELAAWLFGYQVPEAAEEYDEVVDTIRGVLLDEIV